MGIIVFNAYVTCWDGKDPHLYLFFARLVALERNSAGHMINSGDIKQCFDGYIPSHAKKTLATHDGFQVKRHTILLRVF